MAVEVVMPQLGESVVEGTVSKWLKQEGEAVQEYEPLLEVSTDKVDTEVPAPASGVLLKVVVQAGETVEKGTVLAMIGKAGEAGASTAELAATDSQSETETITADMQDAFNEPDEQAVAAATSPGNGHTGHITPVVARMAAEHQLDLSRIQGTGRGGRVTKKDVEAYLKTRPASAPAAHDPLDDTPPWERPGSGDLFKPTVDYDEAGATDAAPAARPAASAAKAPQRAHPVEAIPQGTPGELVPLTPMRRSIAEHMVRSKLQTSPHVTTVFEIDMSAVLRHREATKDSFARQGVNLTLTAYFVAATVEALRANPYLNGEWTGEGIYVHHAMHISMAVALDDGLIVPVIRNAQDLNLLGLARAVNDLAARARAKQLSADEIRGGTFTITNHGVSGSLFATPIINQPQVGILGVGMVEKRVKVIDDAIAIRPCVYLSLTFDHRVVDGAVGDSFLLAMKHRLEGWR